MLSYLSYVPPTPRFFHNITITDFDEIPGVPSIRIFAPSYGVHKCSWLYINSVATSLSPIILFMHGGGFVLCSARSVLYSGLLETFAAHGFIVVSVEYRKPPEFKFPVAVEDCDSVLQWLERIQSDQAFQPAALRNANFSDITLMGDSAGYAVAGIQLNVLRWKSCSSTFYA